MFHNSIYQHLTLVHFNNSWEIIFVTQVPFLVPDLLFCFGKLSLDLPWERLSHSTYTSLFLFTRWLQNCQNCKRSDAGFSVAHTLLKERVVSLDYSSMWMWTSNAFSRRWVKGDTVNLSLVLTSTVSGFHSR